MTRRRVVIVAFPDVQALDVAGPAEVFAQAGGYGVQVAGPTREPLPTGSGYAIVPDLALADVRGPVDTLVVAGGAGTRAAHADDGLTDWLSGAAPRARRVASVCTGAFLLARAGLLDGRRVTTHWEWCETLARAYPSVTVDPDPIFVTDGSVWTSAGVTAGMDLALALVETTSARSARSTSPATSCCSCAGPAGSRSSAPGCARRARRARRCANCRRGSPTTSAPISPWGRSRRAPT